jgi:hypothetical protein
VIDFIRRLFRKPEREPVERDHLRQHDELQQEMKAVTRELQRRNRTDWLDDRRSILERDRDR